MSVALTGHGPTGPQHFTDESRAKMSASHKGLRKGVPLSMETKAKMSLAQMGNKKNLGHHHSPETCARISAAQKGKAIPLETRAKLSAACMGRTVWNKGIFGAQNGNWKGGPVVAGRKHSAKHRGLGWLSLNPWFVGSEGHHVTKTIVIYVPKALNQGFGHDIWTGRGMEKINALAVQWLTGDGFSC